MNEQNKHRLIGGVILVAVLSVLVFLFVNKHDRGDQLVPIPSEEEAKTKTISVTLPSAKSGGEIKINGETKVKIPPPPSLEKMRPQPAPPPGATPKLPDNPLAIPKRPSASAAPTHQLSQRVKPQKRVKHQKGWVAQIGSFSNKSNAKRLLARLHSRGFHAYLRPVATTTKHKQKNTYYQIIVGPAAGERKTAEQRLARLRQSLHLRGFVIKL